MSYSYQFDEHVDVRGLAPDELMELQTVFHDICCKRGLVNGSGRAADLASDLMQLYRERRSIRELRTLFSLPPTSHVSTNQKLGG